MVTQELERKCFIDMKAAMSRTPTLALPDFSKSNGIQVDTLDFGIGGVFVSAESSWERALIANTGRKMS